MARQLFLIAVLSFSTIAGFTQGPPPPPVCAVPPCAPVPLDTNLIVLVAAGVGFALRQLYKKQKMNEKALVP